MHCGFLVSRLFNHSCSRHRKLAESATSGSPRGTKSILGHDDSAQPALCACACGRGVASNNDDVGLTQRKGSDFAPAADHLPLLYSSIHIVNRDALPAVEL